MKGKISYYASENRIQVLNISAGYDRTVQRRKTIFDALDEYIRNLLNSILESITILFIKFQNDIILSHLCKNFTGQNLNYLTEKKSNILFNGY